MEPTVNEIVSWAKIRTLEVDSNDINELAEEHNQELTTEELTELHCVSQQEVMEESLTEEEEHKGCLYLNILKWNLKLSVQNLGTGNTFAFYQDNNPMHTAHNIRLCCLYTQEEKLCFSNDGDGQMEFQGLLDSWEVVQSTDKKKRRKMIKINELTKKAQEIACAHFGEKAVPETMKR
ncbi:hypothetical protein AVEN_135271-1 [Araneus ventricosus]|uniref:DDE-1 domain-containing protein n=1 Tax=Araneus ventricosus TaxID=182803 RepID=A0A4Y2CPR7_ARAVE|nr:hypothetical protein AVEN_135271-1 [Araneus ventricosus]